MYWNYDAMDAKWYLFVETDEGDKNIAEVGQDEDGTYYWADDNGDGYCDFATAEEAIIDADIYLGVVQEVVCNE